MNNPYVVNIGKQFSRFPAGRYAKKGPASGEEFREKVLVPLLDEGAQEIIVELDDAIGYGSSFLEEAFGGLIRAGATLQDLKQHLRVKSTVRVYVDRIWRYIEEEAARSQ